MVLAVVLSQVSTNSEIFKFYVESTIVYLLHKKLNKVIVQFLIYDCDVPQTHDKLLKILAEKNFRKQKRFRKICQKNGLSTYIGRTGSKEMSKMSTSLATACGNEVSSHTSLVLKWDIFVNVVENSDNAIVEIEKLKI